MLFRFRNLAGVALAALLLSGCATDRAADAAVAKAEMIGMSKEHVLACMGIPTRKAQEGDTEVWSYNIKGADGTSASNSFKYLGETIGFGSSQKYSCTANIVMVDGRVDTVHYNGPTGNVFAPDEQCGYLVRNCVTAH
jgi:hypothetical protein